MKIRNCLYHYLEQFMQNRCSSRLERVRLGVFIASSVLFTLIVSLHILGTIGLDCLWLYVLSWVWIAVSVSSVTLYLLKRLSLIHVLIFQTVSLQVIQSLRVIVLLNTNHTGYETMLIVSFFLTYTLLMYLTLALMRKLTILVTLLNLLTLLYVGIHGHGVLHMNFIIVFTLLFLFTSIVSLIAYRSVRELQKEYADVQTTQSHLQNVFNMSPDEFQTYLHLSQSGASDGNARHFLAQLDDSARRNLVQAVLSLVGEEEASRRDLSTRFPQLTEAELEVCRLVLQGKSLRDIARITGKSTNNVSTVRGNVRKKLGLPSGIDLKDFLAGG